MIFIELENEPGFSENLLEAAARATLQLSNAPDADLTLVITSDEQVHRLNRDFLGIDAPTDVLSFPANETDPETDRLYLGDVVISLPRAAEQASVRGHPLASEVQLLVIHGTLHLMGYDHAEPGEKARMWALQSGVLDALGLKVQIPEE